MENKKWNHLQIRLCKRQCHLQPPATSIIKTSPWSNVDLSRCRMSLEQNVQASEWQASSAKAECAPHAMVSRNALMFHSERDPREACRICGTPEFLEHRPRSSFCHHSPHNVPDYFIWQHIWWQGFNDKLILPRTASTQLQSSFC